MVEITRQLKAALKPAGNRDAQVIRTHNWWVFSELLQVSCQCGAHEVGDLVLGFTDMHVDRGEAWRDPLEQAAQSREWRLCLLWGM